MSGTERNAMLAYSAEFVKF